MSTSNLLIVFDGIRRSSSRNDPVFGLVLRLELDSVKMLDSDKNFLFLSEGLAKSTLRMTPPGCASTSGLELQIK